MLASRIEHFKDIHKNEGAIVFGTGPSLEKYDNRFDDGRILVGTNEMVYYHKPMDYYFIGDAGNKKRGYLSDPATYNKYRPKIQKFYRNIDKNGVFIAPELPKNQEGVIYYDVIQKRGFRFFDTIPPFSDALSISFEALQFCLMSGFKKIYLIGHDCDYTDGSFKTKDVGDIPFRHCPRIIESWEMFKILVEKKFPYVKIINVNPVKMRFFEILEI